MVAIDHRHHGAILVAISTKSNTIRQYQLYLHQLNCTQHPCGVIYQVQPFLLWDEHIIPPFAYNVEDTRKSHEITRLLKRLRHGGNIKVKPFS